MAITKLPLFPAGMITAIGEPFVSFSLVFLPLEPGEDVNLAHEIGHVLWSDAGQGKKGLNNPNMPQELRDEYRSRMEKMLGDLKLGLPVADLMKMLENDDHSQTSSNLMFSLPQSNSVNLSCRLRSCVGR